MMKFSIYILLFFLFVLESEASNFDKIDVVDTSIVWTEHGEYDKSDIKIKPGGLVVEYDNHVVYKDEYGDRNYAYQFTNSLGELEKYYWLFHNDFPDTVNTFEIFPDENKIYFVEYSDSSTRRYLDRGKFNFKIESQHNDKIELLLDTIVSLNHPRYFLSDPARFDFLPPANILRINDTKFLIEFNFYTEMDIYYYEADKVNIIVDIENNKLLQFKQLDYKYLNFSPSGNNIGAGYKSKNVTQDNIYHGPDEFTFYNIENDSLYPLEKFGDKDGETNCRFVNLLNDTLAFFQYENNLYIYNYQSDEEESKFSYQNLTLHNSVIVDDKYLLFDSKRYDNTFRSIIHIPSQNMIIDTILNQPYQGYLLTQLKNDQILSIGDSNYIYRSNVDFDLDIVEADFDYELTDDLTYKFKDRSKGPLVNWTWDFGDGNASYDRNPTFKFDGEGTYEVKLIVENEFGSKDTATTGIEIKKKVQALFTSSGPTGKAPHTVTFKSLRNTNVVKWIWNFGDYNYSYEENPTHTFTKPGIYDVSLTVFDEDGNFDIYKFDDFITVEE